MIVDTAGMEAVNEHRRSEEGGGVDEEAAAPAAAESAPLNEGDAANVLQRVSAVSQKQGQSYAAIVLVLTCVLADRGQAVDLGENAPLKDDEATGSEDSPCDPPKRRFIV